jgi:hypothetical protein
MKRQVLSSKGNQKNFNKGNYVKDTNKKFTRTGLTRGGVRL